MMNLNYLKTDQDYSAAASEQRAYPRVPTCNLISYTTVNRGDSQSDCRMGRALDVSQSGLYLETARRVSAGAVSLMASDMKENLIEIQGRVAYSREDGQGMFRTGIRFEGTHNENVGFAKKLIRVYHNRKTGYHISTDRSDRF